MKKILLAGGNGIIGSYLCFQLKEQASVTSIGYSNYPNKKDFINIDFTKMSQVTEFAEICDHFDVLIFFGLSHIGLFPWDSFSAVSRNRCLIEMPIHLWCFGRSCWHS